MKLRKTKNSLGHMYFSGFTKYDCKALKAEAALFKLSGAGIGRQRGVIPSEINSTASNSAQAPSVIDFRLRFKV